MSVPRWPLPVPARVFAWRGITFTMEKTLLTKTLRLRADSGRVDRIKQWAHPLYEYTLKWEWIRSDRGARANVATSGKRGDLKLLAGFIAQRGGGFEPFAWPDPYDYWTQDEVISASAPAPGADPTNPDARNYQVVRTYGGAVAPVGVVNENEIMVKATAEAAPVVKVDNVSVSFTANAPLPGWVRLAVAPTPTKVITFTGAYWARVVLKEDKLPMALTADDFWTIKGITMETDPE